MKSLIRTFAVALLALGVADRLILAQDSPSTPPPAAKEAAKPQSQDSAKPADSGKAQDAGKPVDPPKPQDSGKPGDPPKSPDSGTPDAGNSSAPGVTPDNSLKVPKLVMSSEAHNFGVVSYGQKVEAKVTLTNEGNADLEIRKVKGSCACTVPQRNIKKLLAPGESTEMSVSFDSKKKQGTIATVVYIDTNDPARPKAQFHMNGTVMHLLAVDPPTGVVIRSLTRDKVNTATVKLSNRTEDTVKPEIKSVGIAGVEAEIKELTPNKEYELIVRTKPPLEIGRQNGVIQISTGLERMPTLSVQIVTDMVSMVELRQPAVWVKPQPSQSDHTVVLRYFGTSPDFKISEIVSNVPSLTVEQKPMLRKVHPKDEEGKTPQARPSLECQLIVHVGNAADIPAEGAKVIVKTTEPGYEQNELMVTTDRAIYSKIMTAKTGAMDINALAGLADEGKKAKKKNKTQDAKAATADESAKTPIESDDEPAESDDAEETPST